MKRRSAVAAGAVLLCLSCSWSSALIVANVSGSELTIRAQFPYDIERDGTLPIRFAPANAMSAMDAWELAPPGAVSVDTDGRVVHVAVPAGTAVRIVSASNCDRPESCHSFPLTSLEITGRHGSLVAEGEVLHAAFARETRYRWILWYPLVTAHAFWPNLRARQAAVLFTTVAVAIFAVWTAVVVARTPMPRRWGWAAIALLGVGELAINWTTGETVSRLFAFPLPGASMTRSSLVGPWMIAVSFPVGAIIALIKRHRARRQWAGEDVVTAHRASGRP